MQAAPPRHQQAQSVRTLAAMEGFASCACLVVGDVMLDSFVYGAATRVSPEAPIPVFSSQQETMMPGGAGNVLRNLVTLGGQGQLAGVIGRDAAGTSLEGLLQAMPGAAAHLVPESGRLTPHKTRYIAGGQQLLRVDHEDAQPITAETQEALVAQCREILPRHRVLILSDYAKGTLPPPLLQALMAEAMEAGVAVLVDPKQWNIALYAGATVLSPNESEMAAFHHGPFASESAMIAAARDWCQTYDIGAIAITRGARGMVLVDRQGLRADIPAIARDVYDVSGAGDTAVAALALGVAAGLELDEALWLANQAAGLAVAQLGTAAVHAIHLKAAIHTQEVSTSQSKLVTTEEATAAVQAWQQQGLRVGFTNGCFDMLHMGHIYSLQQCRQHCDRLVVAINSDASVARLKGPERPVHGEIERALLLAAMRDVDLVIVFNDDTPRALLQGLRPDILMKGEDYAPDAVVGRDIVEGYGGQVVRIPLKEGYSTTQTLARLRETA